MTGADFLDAIEESRIKGEVIGSMNATIIFLIPKKDKQDTYNDFKPISTCNLIYKVITNMMKPIMDKYIFKELFGFLSNRQILDAIGIAQEILHSIETKTIPTLILKMDLIKAYHHIGWTFLLQIGLHMEVTNCIMGCISSAIFLYWSMVLL